MSEVATEDYLALKNKASRLNSSIAYYSGLRDSDGPTVRTEG